MAHTPIQAYHVSDNDSHLSDTHGSHISDNHLHLSDTHGSHISDNHSHLSDTHGSHVNTGLSRRYIILTVAKHQISKIRPMKKCKIDMSRAN